MKGEVFETSNNKMRFSLSNEAASIFLEYDEDSDSLIMYSDNANFSILGIGGGGGDGSFGWIDLLNTAKGHSIGKAGSELDALHALEMFGVLGNNSNRKDAYIDTLYVNDIQGVSLGGGEDNKLISQVAAIDTNLIDTIINLDLDLDSKFSTLKNKVEQNTTDISGKISEVISKTNAIIVSNKNELNLDLTKDSDFHDLKDKVENANFDYNLSADAEFIALKDDVNNNTSNIANLNLSVSKNTADIKENEEAIKENSEEIATIVHYNLSTTDFKANNPINQSFYDTATKRIISHRNYFNLETDAVKMPLTIINEDGSVINKGLRNPVTNNQSRYEGMACPFRIDNSGDIYFATSESPKDHPFIRLKADNDLEFVGGEDGLKICQNWGYLNYIVPLDNDKNNRFNLLVGNPINRLDPNGGNGSRQAQIVLLLDVEDMINQNKVEEYTDNNSGITYGTCTKTINVGSAGIPVVIENEVGHNDVYLFQPDKFIKKLKITDLETKDVVLQNHSAGKLEFGYLLDGDGKRIAEKGKINGITKILNRFVVFHQLNIGIQSYDTVENTLTLLHATDNWIEYGLNQINGDNAPHLFNKLYFVPHSNIGHDGVTVPLKMIIIAEDLQVTTESIPLDNFKCISSTKSSVTKITCTSGDKEVYIYDVNSKEWEEKTVSNPILSGFDVLDQTYFTPRITKQSDGSYPEGYYYKTVESLDDEIVANSDLLQNNIIKGHEDFIIENKPRIDFAYNQVHTNSDAILSNADAIDDFITPKVKVFTEDENADVGANRLFEHALPLFPEKDSEYYHLINQRFFILNRMYEGSGYSKEILELNDYPNDQVKNLILCDIVTGKTKELADALVQIPINPFVAYGTMRGLHIIPHEDGSQDCYLWINNPLRSVSNNQFSYNTVPLYRISIPADVDNSDPFANVTTGFTNIRCDKNLFDYPAEHPYGNYVSDLSKKYQYEISPVTFTLTDTKTKKEHLFFMSMSKNSRDYVTHRVFEFKVDESNKDNGVIVPVGAHTDSDNGHFASGYFAKKKDVNGIERLFMFSVVGLTELYFVDDGGSRKPELRNYKDYTPEGDAVRSEIEFNAINQPLILEKGIRENWYKSDFSNPQWLSDAPIDENDDVSCLITWFQGGYGVCSLTIKDLGNNAHLTKLENNYQGSDLSSLHIQREGVYQSFLQESSVKGLMRFNARQFDTRALGSTYYFDYKSDYLTDNNAWYNDTRKYDENNNKTFHYNFKRGIIEVKYNASTSKIEIHAISTGRKRSDNGAEEHIHQFSGESVCKIGGVFVCSAAFASHSSITKPRVYVFDPSTHTFSPVSNTETNMTSLFASRKNGLVLGSSMGTDSEGNPTQIHMVEMLASQNISQSRIQNNILTRLANLEG